MTAETERTAIVTGAARGIGRAIAVALADTGCRVALADLKEAGETAELIGRKGGRARTYALDVADGAAVTRMVETAEAELGAIDILVNNAGIIHRGGFLDLAPGDWQRVLDVNLGGAFNFCRAVVPGMIKRGGGKIVNITSVAGLMGDITASPAYGTSKGAVNTLTKSLARQLAAHHITVNAVAPHAIETDMSRQWSAAKRKSIIAAIPLGRLGRPEEVAAAVLYLCSGSADFITGEIINVNGGFLMD